MTDTLGTSLDKSEDKRTAPREKQDMADVIARMKPALEKSLGRADVAEMLMRHYLTGVQFNERGNRVVLWKCRSAV